MADDVLNRIEKHMEGNSLALSAVAEVLQKMDDRFGRDEDIALAKQQEEDAIDERTAMVKAIASEVYGMIKADNGMDVDGTKVRSGTKMKGRGEDVETAINPTTKIADQQATIQAARDDEDEEENPFKKNRTADERDDEELDKGHDEDDDGAAEHPKEEARKGMYKEGDKDEDKDEDDEISAMAKELDALKKQMAETESNMQKAIQSESENRLRKMGFREEVGLQAPQMISPLGTDGSTPIVKSENAMDTVDQLTNLSWKELRNLQTQIEMGNTDGVPRELL
jgi:hypothetical protein